MCERKVVDHEALADLEGESHVRKNQTCALFSPPILSLNRKQRFSPRGEKGLDLPYVSSVVCPVGPQGSLSHHTIHDQGLLGFLMFSSYFQTLFQSCTYVPPDS